jgi:CheY-like chemotaxis protein
VRSSTRSRRGVVLKKTGELVVERGVATADQVATASVEGRARGEPLCTRLLAAGIDEAELVAVLSEKHGVPGVDLSRTAISLELLDLIPRAVAEGDLILPLSLEGDRLHLAMARPADERVLAEVRFVTGLEASPYVAIRGSILRSIAEAYAERARDVPLWRGNACASGVPHIEAVIGGEVVECGEAIPDAEIVIEVEPPSPVDEEAPAAARPLVLVVDDEPEIRLLVQRTLLAKGYRVEVAQDGAEAVEKAEKLVPALVLLDAMLPRVHGFEACRRIKASPATRRVPVVMMTAIYRGWRFAQDAKDSYGAEDYVEKPFRLEDLLRRIEGAMLSAAGRPPVATDDAADPRIAHGKELLAEGHVAEAISALAEAVHANPHCPDGQFQLGRALRAGGDAFGAMTALERAAELAPAHLPALRALAALYEETGFRRKAAEILERALPAAGDDDARSAIRRDLLRLIA